MDLSIFAVMVFGIVLLPGMDMTFIASQSLARGRLAGAIALLGVIVGGVMHVLIAAAGISAVLRQMPNAQNALLLTSALYLVWISIGIWQAGAEIKFVAQQRTSSAASSTTYWKIFAGAMLTNLLNPKAYLFMLAVFPQFVDFQRSVWPQALRMGLIIAAIQLLIYGAVVIITSQLRRWASQDQRWQTRLAKAVAILLGLTAIVSLFSGWRH